MKPFIKTTDIDCLENRNPELVHRLARFFKPLFWHYFRPEIQGLERIPEGAGMFVGNHNGALLMPDLFIFGIALYERFGIDGLPYGMGHETGIGFPILHRLFLPIGGVRCSQQNAHLLLAAGEKLLVYPGGELDSMRSFRKRTRIIFKVLEPIRFECDGPEAASDAPYVEACHRQVHSNMETTLNN